LLRGESLSVRDVVLTGWWGREVNMIIDGWKYTRTPEGPNAPLSMWSNRWSTMPVPRLPGLTLPHPDSRAFLDHMPGSDVPVIRQPFVEGDMLPYWALGKLGGNCVYNLRDDPHEERNLAGTPVEKDLADRLREALKQVEAPDDQFVRLGLG
jgi:hypothetical protein